MGEGWSEGRKDLVPSNGPVDHPDRRMSFKIGSGDIDPCNITHRDSRTPPPLVLSAYAGKHALHSQDYLIEAPRPASERELLAAAAAIARNMLHERFDQFLATTIAELRANK